MILITLLNWLLICTPDCMRNRLNGFGRILMAGVLLTASAAVALAQDPPKPDNTKTNKQDRSPNAATADKQKDNKSDRETARQIRKAIVDDKSLSTYAHNVKVISQHGTVTLKGPVRSEEEKKAIEDKAIAVAGADNVKNELTVVSADSSKKPRK
jgi:hyperosmotically inducible periplasmic protein